MLPSNDSQNTRDHSSNNDSQKGKPGNKSCSLSSVKLKEPLKSLLPADYVPKKLDFSKNEGETEIKNSAFLKRKWSYNTERKPLELKVRKEFLKEHQTLWQKNADFAFEPNEYVVNNVVNKKVKTEEAQASQEAETHGVCLKDLEGYQIVKVQRRDLLTLLLKTNNSQEYFSLLVLPGSSEMEKNIPGILKKLEANKILLKIYRFWANSKNQHFFLVEAIDMELSRVIVKPFSEKETKQIIKDLAVFSKFLLENQLFLSLGIDNMVFTAKNEVKLLLNFESLNPEKQMLKGLENLNLMEHNFLFVEQIGLIAFFLMAKIKEFDIKTIKDNNEYSSEIKSLVSQMVGHKVTLEELIALN